jgi:hypothetical protein
MERLFHFAWEKLFLLSPKDFVAAWGKNDPVIRFRKKTLELLAFADEDKEFLSQAGLPESVAPFMSFTAPKSGELPTVADLYSWLVAMRTARSGSIRPDSQERLRGAALHALSDDDRTVRGNAASLLGEVGDATVLPALRDALKKESYWLTEQTIANAIKGLEGRL